MSYDYSKNNQLFQSYNPSYTGRLNFALTQPLLKNFGWTVSRRAIVIAQNSFDISRSQFKTVLMETVYNVEAGYWNLVYAIENLKTLQQALESGRDLLTKTKREVQVGTKAPDRGPQRRGHRGPPRGRHPPGRSPGQAQPGPAPDAPQPGRRSRVAGARPSCPADKPEFKPFAITLEEAYAKAMARRPELESAKSAIGTKMVNFRFAKNQLLPQLDLQLVQGQPGHLRPAVHLRSGQSLPGSPRSATPAAPRRPSGTSSSSSTTTGRPA
ncbi:MAG: TolC family protein [Marinilabiliales bacterium]|nr:TolC family protein [Marinilabiliales bacterium]